MLTRATSLLVSANDDEDGERPAGRRMDRHGDFDPMELGAEHRRQDIAPSNLSSNGMRSVVMLARAPGARLAGWRGPSSAGRALTGGRGACGAGRGLLRGLPVVGMITL
jgi:hypothetical protein